jgi:hypothetical protein
LHHERPTAKVQESPEQPSRDERRSDPVLARPHTDRETDRSRNDGDGDERSRADEGLG